MNKPSYTFALFALTTSLLFFSFTIKRPKKIVPPGTVQINETFFADQFEISNRTWQEFENWTRIKYGKFSAQHLASLPDTLVWRKKNSYNEPYVIYYYRHPAYKDYPVVGISYEQALEFCKWRTERVKEFYSLAYKKSVNIEYRLPTKAEWELISCNGEGVLNQKARNEKGQILFNHRYAADSADAKKTVNHPADVTAPVKSYWKNRFGLWCMFGNVAEMVDEKGICKGGGWRHLYEECRAGNDITYTGAESWLGFRCVCTFTSS